MDTISHAPGSRQSPPPELDLVELARQQARRDLNQAQRAMFAIYLRTAETRRDAIAAIEEAAGLMHANTSWYTQARIAKAVEDVYPDRPQRHLRVVAVPISAADTEKALGLRTSGDDAS